MIFFVFCGMMVFDSDEDIDRLLPEKEVEEKDDYEKAYDKEVEGDVWGW